MNWLPSDPKLAREFSSMMTELEIIGKLDKSALERALPRCHDMLGRLVYIWFGVVPEDMINFIFGVNQFINELPTGSVAHYLLRKFFRQPPEGAPDGEREAVLNFMYQLYWSARWYEFGCPAVTIESKLAASLMATETDAEFIPVIKPPWDCFVVRLPMELVELGQLNFTHLVVHRHIKNFLTDMGGWLPTGFRDQQEVNEFFGRKTGVVWGFYGMNNASMNLSMTEPLAVLLGEERLLVIPDPVDIATTPGGRRIRALARLVVGICHMAENPNTLRRKSTKKQPHRWRFSKLPTTTEYVLAPEVPVRFDCTEAIGAHLRGEKKGPPRVQYVVRGHWRNQAHGPGRLERKRIWIQPYWKGPEDVPRLFREHRLDATPEGAD